MIRTKILTFIISTEIIVCATEAKLSKQKKRTNTGKTKRNRENPELGKTEENESTSILL